MNAVNKLIFITFSNFIQNNSNELIRIINLLLICVIVYVIKFFFIFWYRIYSAGKIIISIHLNYLNDNFVANADE